jgi:hypothetical protein
MTKPSDSPGFRPEFEAFANEIAELTDEQLADLRREASCARLGVHGWVFTPVDGHWAVYNDDHDNGASHWFGNKPDSLDRAIKYASVNQLQMDARREKR